RNEGTPPHGGAEPGAMALVTLAETKVTRRKGARRPKAEHSVRNTWHLFATRQRGAEAAGDLLQTILAFNKYLPELSDPVIL
ncbi:hypothetical protein, partial [Pseudomonas cichorii]|uniref:hypothetical protein n=1 Tax=Pseudomonas cichorii TaxID=36746 RepID=UPI001E37A981